MAEPRKAFVDADIWINLSLVAAIDILFALYPSIYIAREVVTEINRYGGEPYKQFGRKLRNGLIKVIDLEDDFEELTKKLLKRQRDEYEFRIGFIKNRTKNLGEFASVQYANELGIDIFMSDDKEAKPILERDFDIRIRDHCDLLIEAEEIAGIIKSPKAIEIYNEIEKLKDKPSGCSYSVVKKIRRQL